MEYSQRPIGVDDSVITQEDRPVTVVVLDNDWDPDMSCNDSGMFTSQIVDDASDGTCVKNSDNTVTYTPDANFNGFDECDYELCDCEGDCTVATGECVMRAYIFDNTN